MNKSESGSLSPSPTGRANNSSMSKPSSKRKVEASSPTKAADKPPEAGLKNLKSRSKLKKAREKMTTD